MRLRDLSVRLFRGLQSFQRGEGGLVTVEWMALVGAAVIGVVAFAYTIANSASTPAIAVGNNLTDCDSLGSPQGCQ